MGTSTSGMGVRTASAALALTPILIALSGAARADEGGVSFWIPGTYASLAAVPSAPGWSVSGISLMNPGKAGGGKTFPRGGQAEVDLNATGIFELFGPTYTFADPVLGGQLSVGILGALGRVD